MAFAIHAHDVNGDATRNLHATLQKLSATGTLTDIWNHTANAWQVNPAGTEERIPLTAVTGFGTDFSGSYLGTTNTNLEAYTGFVVVRVHDEDNSNVVVNQDRVRVRAGVEELCATPNDVVPQVEAVVQVPATVELPKTGAQQFHVEAFFFDANGLPVVPTGAPVLTTLVDEGGVNLIARVANANPMQVVGTGHYRATYTMHSSSAAQSPAHKREQMLWTFTYDRGFGTETRRRKTQVEDTAFLTRDAITQAQLHQLVAEASTTVTDNSLWARLHDSQSPAVYTNYSGASHSLRKIGDDTTTGRNVLVNKVEPMIKLTSDPEPADSYQWTTKSLEHASGASAASIADAVWDEPRSGHTTAGSFGEGILVADKTGFSISGTIQTLDALVSPITAGVWTTTEGALVHLTAGTKLATMLQASGPNWQFTADAQALAPVGGGTGILPQISVIAPPIVEIPTSGNTDIRVYIYTLDSGGQPVNADTTPTLQSIGPDGTNRDANFQGPVTADGTGRYYRVYRVSTSHAAEQINFEGNGTIATEAWRDADQTSVQSAMAAIQNANVVQVGGTTVSEISEFHASTTALQTILDKVDTMLMVDPADSQKWIYTVASLGNAATGGGAGDATLANQTTIISHLTDIKGAGWLAIHNLVGIYNFASTAAGNAGSISPIQVAPARSWKIQPEGDHSLSPNIVVLHSSSQVTLSMDFSATLNPGTSIASGTVVDESGNPITITNPLRSQDAQKIHFDVAGLQTLTQYDLRGVATTTEGDQIVGTGTLIVE